MKKGDRPVLYVARCDGEEDRDVREISEMDREKENIDLARSSRRSTLSKLQCCNLPYERTLFARARVRKGGDDAASLTSTLRHVLPGCEEREITPTRRQTGRTNDVLSFTALVHFAQLLPL